MDVIVGRHWHIAGYYLNEEGPDVMTGPICGDKRVKGEVLANYISDYAPNAPEGTCGRCARLAFGNVPVGGDWRCECGDLNRYHEVFCYRCGAGQPEDDA